MWKLIEKIDISQGSETGAVVYYLGSSVSWQNWQHVYTAVTRGKKEVHILGTHLVLSKAIAAKPNVRWTSLKYQLNKILPVSWSFYSPWVHTVNQLLCECKEFFSRFTRALSLQMFFTMNQSLLFSWYRYFIFKIILDFILI